MKFVASIFPTERMDEMLDAITRQSLTAHTEGDYQAVGHHAIVATIEFTEETPGDPVYDVMTIPSPNISEMKDFAEYVGMVTAQLAPSKVFVGTWLVYLAWEIETETAMPTKIDMDGEMEKKEIIVISGVSLDNRHNHTVIQVVRDDNGMIRIPEDGIETFHVNDGVRAYSRNTKHMRDKYMEEVAKRMK
jgi:hypothetical protein